MTTPHITEKKMTVEEFIDFVQLPENADKFWELINGIPVEKNAQDGTNMPPSSKRNTIIAGLIIYHLNAFVIPRKLGFVSTADGGYRMNNGDVYLPDVAFISIARHESLEGVVFPVAPDLAVEIVSPSEDSDDIVKKVQNYLFSGTTLVWLVYPKSRRVFVWQRGTGAGLYVEEFNLEATLTGGDVLPDFTLAVKNIFPE
jgi:Uma2 family endonuclease